MSAVGLLRDAFVSLLIALACGLAPLWLAAGEVPELEVRTRPLPTHGGQLLARHTYGQRFRCERDGLHRIDVALVPLVAPGKVPDGSVQLRLRDGGPEGEVLRTVGLQPGALDPGGELVSFEFSPVADSGGRELCFEVVPGPERTPGDFSAFVRYHGAVGLHRGWGDRVAEWQPVFEDELRSPHANLRALALACVGLAPWLGECRLELFEADAPAGAPPLRVATLAPQEETRTGHAFFGFEPLPDSRWKRYRLRLSLHEGARVLAKGRHLNVKTIHGSGEPDPRLLGATRGAAVLPDRELVFRAWTAPARASALARLAERAGWRLWPGLLVWWAASWLALRAFGRAAGDRNVGKGQDRDARVA